MTSERRVPGRNDSRERRVVRRKVADPKAQTDPNADTEPQSSRLEVGIERRRASRSLWAACEAFLSVGEPERMDQALEALRMAFDCDGVAVHVIGPSGTLEPLCARGAWRSTPGDLRDCMTVPLVRVSKHVGTLDLRAHAGRRWRSGQLGLMKTAAGALGAALGVRMELEQLRRRPGCDPVTGLPDVNAFQSRFAEEVARARRHGLPLALVAVDLDHFAALNRRYGREVGDAALAEAALVLRLSLRESDIVARLEGDGFTVVLPETDAASAVRAADRIRRSIEEHRFARVGRLSASAGVATCPRDGVEGVELLEYAARALSIAKKSGRRRAVSADHAYSH
jgi:diguanylate cyclase (GGDEF)-like protein